MTYNVPRWDCPDVLTMALHPQGMWVLAENAEAHEKAAVEAAVVRLTKTFLEQLTGDDDDVRRALEMAYVAGQEDMLATAIAKVEAAPDTFWAEAQDADELGWLQQHELYVAALRALLTETP